MVLCLAYRATFDQKFNFDDFEKFLGVMQQPLSPPSPPWVFVGQPADQGFQSPSIQHPDDEAPSPGCLQHFPRDLADDLEPSGNDRVGDLLGADGGLDDDHLGLGDNHLDLGLGGVFVLRAFVLEPFPASCTMGTSGHPAQEHDNFLVR